jgi:hypothetical protein
MRCVNDQIHIFSLLEHANRADFSPTAAHVDIFTHDNETAFLTFCPEGICKGALLFLLNHPLLPGEIERDLLPEIMNIHGDSHADELRELAEQKVRLLIEQKPASGYFFDAH